MDLRAQSGHAAVIARPPQHVRGPAHALAGVDSPVEQPEIPPNRRPLAQQDRLGLAITTT